MSGIVNQMASQDARLAVSGANATFHDDEGNVMASIESWQSQVNVTNATYKPCGTSMERGVMTGTRITLTCSQIMVEDDKFIDMLLEGIETGVMPAFNFQGVIHGKTGGEGRIVYRQCVPDGNIDIQNVSTGDIIKRAWNFIVNEPVDMQSKLTR